MLNLNGLGDLIDKGGLVIYTLLPLSVYVTAVIFYKVIQLWFGASSNTAFVDQVIDDLDNNNASAAYEKVSVQRGPVARIMESAIRCIYFDKFPKDVAKEEVARVGAEQLKSYNSHMKGLEMSYNLGPLLGLLGTVSGMVKTFAAIQAAGSRVDPSMLAGGIWEALLNTVVGLAVATPALAAHYILEVKIDKLKLAMKDAVTKVFVASEKENTSYTKKKAA